MTRKKYPMLKIALSWAILGAASSSFAAVSASEAARLKQDLTPVGAEKAGNKAGTIPAWSGGVTKTPPVVGKRPDPFAAEKPLLSINAQNMAQHLDKLTPGAQALLKRYPNSFRMDVYQTHRTGAMPQSYYDATFKDATGTKLTVDANGNSKTENTSGGTPFPFPQSGMEAMYNHLMAFWPPMILKGSNFLIQADGKRILVSTYENNIIRYFNTPERKTGLYWAVRSRTTNPPIRAGEAIVGHYYEDGSKDSSWVYLPGQRRVRRLPNSCCDTPTPFSAGLISFDEIPGTFSGNMSKFNWNLVGKKEMYVPYNGNRIMQAPKSEDIFSQYHLNPDHVRWELHRVWVVEAKLKEGQRHISPRSTYYLDEDTWQGLLADRYDAQDKLARTGFMNPILVTEESSFVPGTWGWYDLLSGAAYIANVYNDYRDPIRIYEGFPASTFSPEALAGDGVR